MDKLQKKCLVATTIMHALLLLVMVVGTAFFNSEKKPVDTPRIIEIRDFKLTDGASHGGGSPVAIPAPAPAPAPAPPPEPKPPQPQPVQPSPPPEPEPVPEPKRQPVSEPKAKTVEPKETVSELPVPKKPIKTPAADPVPKTSAKTTVKHTPVKRNIDISKPVTRDNRDKVAAQRAAEAAAQHAAEQRLKALQSAFSGAQKNISDKLSSATTFDSVGFGGGGQAEINYGEYVLAKYDAAWIAPLDVDDNVAIVKARVVIARSGKVISSEIIRSSRNSTLDKSVRRALDSVSFIERFPEGATDSQRTYIINFNLKSKRGIG